MTQNKQKLILFFILCWAVEFFLTGQVLAFDKSASTYLDNLANRQEIKIKTDKTLPEVVGGVIKYGVGFLGIIFLILILYAGFLWMTAGGSQEDVTKARAILKWSIIGVIVVLGAYVISYYVVIRINEAANAPRPLTPNINIEGEEDDILDPVDINYIDCTEVQSSCAGCGRDEYCCANLGSCCVFKHGSCAVPN